MIRICEGEVSAGNVTVEPGIGVRRAVAAKLKAGDAGRGGSGGFGKGRIAAVGHVQLAAGEAEANRLHAARVERADQVEGSVVQNAEHADAAVGVRARGSRPG